MSYRTFLLAACLCAAQTLFAQNERFSYAIRLDFPNFSLPFDNFKENFRNGGLSFEVRYAYAEPTVSRPFGTTQQVLQIGYFRNRYHGDHYFVNTQFAVAPTIGQNLEVGASLGVGYLWASAPGDNFQSDGNGNWATVRNTKGFLTIPLGIRAGYHTKLGSVNWTPFLSYQIMPTIGYNDAIPIGPLNQFSVGNQFKF